MQAEAEAASPELLINGDALKSNLMSIHYVRSLMAITVGICAGIAGLTNSSGFLLYICMHFITSLFLFLKMHGNVQEYLQPGTNAWWFALDGLTGQGLSFVMFWTLSFAMIHIF